MNLNSSTPENGEPMNKLFQNSPDIPRESDSENLYKTALEGLTESEFITPENETPVHVNENAKIENDPPPNNLKSSEFPSETVELVKLRYQLMNSRTENSKLENKIKLMETEVEFYKQECMQLRDKNTFLMKQLEVLNSDKSLPGESIQTNHENPIRKSVTFNQNSLTPEIIDSKLPVSTPVRKGRKPENPKDGTPKAVSIRTGLLKKNHLKNSHTESTPRTDLKLDDSLSIQCHEATEALKNLKNKFSDRTNVVLSKSPEKEKEVLNSSPIITFDSSSSEGVSTPRRTLNNIQALSEQMKNVRLDQTPMKLVETREDKIIKDLNSDVNGIHVTPDSKEIPINSNSEPILNKESDIKNHESDIDFQKATTPVIQSGGVRRNN